MSKLECAALQQTGVKVSAPLPFDWQRFWPPCSWPLRSPPLTPGPWPQCSKFHWAYVLVRMPRCSIFKSPDLVSLYKEPFTALGRAHISPHCANSTPTPTLTPYPHPFGATWARQYRKTSVTAYWHACRQGCCSCLLVTLPAWVSED